MSRLDKPQLATILAALHLYREEGMGEPDTHNLGHTFHVVAISERHSLALALRVSDAHAEAEQRAAHERERG